MSVCMRPVWSLILSFSRLFFNSYPQNYLAHESEVKLLSGHLLCWLFQALWTATMGSSSRILQASVLGWRLPYSPGDLPQRDRPGLRIAGRRFTIWATGEDPSFLCLDTNTAGASFPISCLLAWAFRSHFQGHHRACSSVPGHSWPVKKAESFLPCLLLDGRLRKATL